MKLSIHHALSSSCINQLTESWATVVGLILQIVLYWNCWCFSQLCYTSGNTIRPTSSYIEKKGNVVEFDHSNRSNMSIFINLVDSADWWPNIQKFHHSIYRPSTKVKLKKKKTDQRSYNRLNFIRLQRDDFFLWNNEFFFKIYLLRFSYNACNILIILFRM